MCVCTPALAKEIDKLDCSSHLVGYLGLPRWLSGKESACNAEATEDSGLIPGLGRSPGGGNGYPLQYSSLESPMDRAWWATYSLWGRKESDTTERLSPSLLSLHPSLSIFAVPSSFASLTAKRSQNDALGQLEKYYCFFSIPLQSSVSFLVHPFFLFF